MSRVKPLTETQIKNAKPKEKEYKLADGNGLYIHIKPNGSKLWRLRYVQYGRSTTKSLGKYPITTLSNARVKALEFKRFLDGDVVETKLTFKELSEEYLDNKSGLNEKYLHDIKSLLKRDFYTPIGNFSASDIEPSHIITILKNMEKRGIKTATRKVGSLLNRIFKYGVSMQYIKSNPMRDIDLSVILKPHKPKNFSHITDEDAFKQLLTGLDNYVGDIYTRTALRLMPYVFLRPANIRGLLWDEIDFKRKIITIPKEKMKIERDHVVPLTDSMIEIIKEVEGNYSKYVFPSPQSTVRQMSENTLNVALKRLGFDGVMTSHGFRHTASTFLHENIHNHKVGSDAIEMQLAHVEKNNVKGVYNKALYMEERTRLMHWWSDYIDNLKTTPT